jgi:hypothetical protein
MPGATGQAVTPAGGGTARLWFWPWIAASLAAVGLLLIFHQVVRGAVLQGELRQVEALAYADAVGRCKRVTGARDRDACLVRVQPQAHHAAILQAPIVQAQGIGP